MRSNVAQQHCTALQQHSEPPPSRPSLLAKKGTERNAFLASAACCTKPPNRDDAPLSPSSKKRKLCARNHAPGREQQPPTHTPIARTGSRTASPSGISRHARTPPRLTLRLTVQSSCPPSPALLPCFHTSTQNRLNCPAAQQLAPSSLRLARASGCMTHVTLEGLVGLVGFFTAGSE